MDDEEWLRRRKPPVDPTPWIFTMTATLWALIATFDWAFVLFPIFCIALLISAGLIFVPIYTKTQAWLYERYGRLKVDGVVGTLSLIVAIPFVLWMVLVILKLI